MGFGFDEPTRSRCVRAAPGRRRSILTNSERRHRDSTVADEVPLDPAVHPHASGSRRGTNLRIDQLEDAPDEMARSMALCAWAMAAF